MTYMYCTASTCQYQGCCDDQITKLDTMSNAFSKPMETRYSCSYLAKYFSRCCLTMKVALTKPNFFQSLFCYDPI